MDDIKRVEGKVIKSISKGTDSVSSYIIIKFEDQSKLNIVSYPAGGKGVGQLDIETSKIKIEDIEGKRIHQITQEYDGENDFTTITFKEGGFIKISSFCTGEECTANLGLTIYGSDKLVKEALNESPYPMSEEETFAQSMYKLEHELHQKDPEAWEDWERKSGKIWRRFGVEDWQNAFAEDYSICMDLKDQLEQILNHI